MFDNMIRVTRDELKNMIKESIQKYMLNEHTNDLKPIICIIIGAPGVGKTTWMHQEANRFLHQQFRELDIDHTQTEFQLQTCNEVAENLITALSNFEVARNHTRNNFESVKAEIQKRLNEKVDAVGSNGMYIDIMQIQMTDRIGKRSLWEWAKNLSRIDNPQKHEEALSVFKSEFYRTYFRKIFAGDFSKRDKVSIRYNERVKAKLSGPNQEMDDVDYNNDSICIATLGKSINDINWYVNQVHHTDSVICVVYLDAPIDVALSQNQKRDRRVSEDFIRNTFNSINNTWDFLKFNLSSTRIWRLFRLEPFVASNNMIQNYKVIENIPNPSMLNIESQMK